MRIMFGTGGGEPPPGVRVDNALAEAARVRDHADGCCSCKQIVTAGDSIAANLARHFPDPEDQRTAALGFIVGTALLGLVAPIEPASSTAAYIAGHRLVTGEPIPGATVDIPDGMDTPPDAPPEPGDTTDPGGTP